MREAAPNPTWVDIDDHPFLVSGGIPKDDTAAGLPHPETVEAITYFAKNLLRDHARLPFDAMVGDDVSGRIPTLIAHRFLRLAYTAGHVDTVPRTFFMAAGPLDLRTSFFQYMRNIEQLASRNIMSYGLTNVLLVSEIRGSGSSLARMSSAFTTNPNCSVSSMVTGGGIYLGGKDKPNKTRALLGVEKYLPDALTRREYDYDAEGGARLRLFLADYTDYIYKLVVQEDPPERPLVNRDSYSTTYQAFERIK